MANIRRYRIVMFDLGLPAALLAQRKTIDHAYKVVDYQVDQ